MFVLHAHFTGLWFVWSESGWAVTACWKGWKGSLMPFCFFLINYIILVHLWDCIFEVTFIRKELNSTGVQPQMKLSHGNWYNYLKFVYIYSKSKVKWSRYRPGVAQRVGRGIVLLFHDHSTRRGWVVSSTPWPHFTPGKDPVPILQEAGWAPGPIWTGGKSRPHRDSVLDCPARSQSL